MSREQRLSPVAPARQSPPDARAGGSSGDSRPTPPRRSIYLDAVRAVALSRIVVYHAVAREWLQVFAALPLMFFVAGSLYAASMERRRTRTVIKDRYRRILPPYWVYVAAMVALWAGLGVLDQLSSVDWIGLAFPVVAVGGPQGPGEGTTLDLTWTALWYLQFHLVLALVGPLLRRAQRRRPRVLWAVMALIFAVGWVAGSPIVVVVFYFGCWVLGYHHHDGDLRQLAQRWWPWLCAATAPLGLALFLVFEARVDVSGVALRFAALGIALLGVGWLALAIGVQRNVEPLLEGRGPRLLVNWISMRAQTIYMWHMPAIYGAITLGLWGSTSWFGVLVWCVLGTVLAAIVVGWVEDLAARRPATLWPRLGPT